MDFSDRQRAYVRTALIGLTLNFSQAACPICDREIKNHTVQEITTCGQEYLARHFPDVVLAPASEHTV